jgi:hypothetical protein
LSEGRHRQPARKPSPPQRRPSKASKRQLPLAVVIVPAVLVAGGAIALFALKGGSVPGIFGGGPDNSTPAFDFRAGKTIAISTNEKVRAQDLQTAADRTAVEATPVIDALFTQAFLNPENWRNSSYEAAFEVFDDAARTSAENQIETVTLGASAGDTYETVSPGKSKLWFRVLFDADSKPKTVVAVVRFHALGKRKDGTYTDITTHAQFFMHDTGDGWKIFSFKVGRTDHETTPPPGPSGSPSASTS